MPIKTPMNDARALRVMKFEAIEDVDSEDDWAEVLTSQVMGAVTHVQGECKVLQLENMNEMMLGSTFFLEMCVWFNFEQ